MDNQNQNITQVHIFGETYSIKSSTEPDYISEVADFIDRKMREISERKTDLNTKEVAILALISITDEFFTIRDKTNEYSEEFKEKTEQILKKLEDSLTKDYTIVKPK